MKLITAFLLACLAAFIFASFSDSLYLKAFGPSTDSSIYSRLDTFRTWGAFVTFISSFSLSLLVLPKQKDGAASAKTSIILLIPGVALSAILSIIFAYAGARAAGVTSGDWNWQFIPAVFGGAAWGFVVFVVGFPLLCRWFKNRYSAFPIALATVCLSAFAISLPFHLLYK